MEDDSGFAQLWRNAQRQRSAFFVSWLSELWPASRKNNRPAEPPSTSNFDEFRVERNTVAKAA